ncbi:MAG: DNA repair exonuclease [Ruminococcaceae bacterium]|nr:DNA repair exonuclease [Oscillospiraceae bacterium]
MKFLHTADLHLDSAFCRSAQSDAAARRHAQRETLKRIFALAKSEGCDMVLIAGDLFDGSFIFPETKDLCIKLFEDFGAPVVIAPGNHDPFLPSSFYAMAKLPENVRVFTSQSLEQIDFSELHTTVAGYAFTSAALPSSPLASAGPAPHEDIYILCAHADLDAPTSRYAPLLTSDIQRYGFDYAALGHVHNPTNVSEYIRYCGFPEGRSFDELGDGYVLTVEISPDAPPIVTSHKISNERYLWQEVSLDGVSSEADARRIIEDTLTTVSNEPTHLRLDVVGTLSEDVLPNLSTLEVAYADRLLSLELRDNTLSLPEGAYLEKDTTLRGEFYRSLLPQLISEDGKERSLALRALKIGLAAIDGKDFIDGGKK